MQIRLDFTHVQMRWAEMAEGRSVKSASTNNIIIMPNSYTGIFLISLLRGKSDGRSFDDTVFIGLQKPPGILRKPDRATRSKGRHAVAIPV